MRDADESTPLLAGGPSSINNPRVKIEEPSKKLKKPSLLRILWRVFGPEIIFAWLFKFIYDCFQFCNPLILK